MPDQSYRCEQDQKQAIIAFIQHTRLGDFPPEVVTQARFCLLDLLGVAAAGSTTTTAKVITEFTAAQMAAGKGYPAVPILFNSAKVSPSGAALAGATLIDSIDAHDGFRPAKGHAGCALLPAILAGLMAKGDEIDEPELLTCLIIGYEIACRAAIALHRTVADYHTSGAWCAIAVAGVTARLAGMSDDEVWHALGIAEYHGPRSQMMRVIDHTTMLKDGSGWGALAGISASALAKTGFTGAPALTLASDDVADIFADLGQEWLILQQYFKPWAVCRWAQPSMQAVLDIVGQMPPGRLELENVQTIHMEVFHEALRLSAPHPKTPDEAQYSLLWPVAALLISWAEERQFGIYDISEAALARPDIHQLADKITLSENADFNAVFPDKRLGRVTLTMKDGTRYSALANHTKGDPEFPLSHDELIEKFETLMQDAGMGKKAEALKKACLEAGTDTSQAESPTLTSLIFG